MRDICITRWAA